MENCGKITKLYILAVELSGEHEEKQNSILQNNHKFRKYF